jgi:hypothetical protein
MSENWIQEEEKILEISTQPSFHPTSLQNIAVRVIYLNSQQEIQGSLKTELALADSSRISWSDLVAGAESTWNSEKYEIGEVMLYHIVKDYDHLSAANPVKLVPIVSWRETEILATLNLFHDLSEIFVFMRPILKPILKKDSVNGYAKTKKVRIMEPGVNPKPTKSSSSSRKTRKIIQVE